MHQRIVYTGRPIIGKYTILAPSDSKVQEWAEGIDRDLRLLQTGEIGRIRDTMPGNRAKLMDGLEGVLSETSDPDMFKLAALGTFFWTNKPAYRGRIKSNWKMINGGTFPIDDFLEEKGNTNCIDAAYWFREMAITQGIQGEVQTIKFKPIPPSHFYFTADDKVLDMLLVPTFRRGGVYARKEDFVRDIRSYHRE